jgi:hypothetical protein
MRRVVLSGVSRGFQRKETKPAIEIEILNVTHNGHDHQKSSASLVRTYAVVLLAPIGVLVKRFLNFTGLFLFDGWRTPPSSSGKGTTGMGFILPGPLPLAVDHCVLRKSKET